MPVLLLAVLCLAGATWPLLQPALADDLASPAAAGRRTLAEPAIEQAVLAALADRRVNVGGATLEISGMSARTAIPGGATLAVERIAYQPAGQRFTAVLNAAGRRPADAALHRGGQAATGHPGAGPQSASAGRRGDYRSRCGMGLDGGSGAAGQRRL